KPLLRVAPLAPTAPKPAPSIPQRRNGSIVFHRLWQLFDVAKAQHYESLVDQAALPYKCFFFGGGGCFNHSK
ncbi:hypothetical protein KUCAC02_006724, partial [Chaenocephalus aceratus]